MIGFVTWDILSCLARPLAFWVMYGLLPRVIETNNVAGATCFGHGLFGQCQPTSALQILRVSKFETCGLRRFRRTLWATEYVRLSILNGYHRG